MAINPMQRKAKNSFILGFSIATLIAIVIIAILFMQILNYRKEEQKEVAASKSVMILSKNIKSGESITASDVTINKIVTNIPDNEIATSGDFTDKTIAKIDMPTGSIITKSMILENDEKTTSDLREQEYNMITLPTDVSENDYVDIRITLPTGQDYIVVSKKRVLKASDTTIWLKLSETEILSMSNAIVEAYIMTGSNLYATKYVDPGIQTASTPTFPVSKAVLGLINSNPNIVEQARTALWQRYNEGGVEQRANIDNELNQYEDSSKENIEAGIQKQIQKQKEERTKYVEMLDGTIY